MSHFNDNGFATIRFNSKKSKVALQFSVHENSLSDDAIEALEEATVPVGMVEAITGLKPIKGTDVVVFKGMDGGKAKLF